MPTFPDKIEEDGLLQFLCQTFPPLAFSAAEFVLLLAGVDIAQKLTQSFWLILLKYAVIIGFAGKAIQRLAITPVYKKRILLSVGGGLLVIPITLALMSAARDAARAALVQLDDKQSEFALGRLEIGREAMKLGMHHQCWDRNFAETPSCLQITRDAQAKETALRQRIFDKP